MCCNSYLRYGKSSKDVLSLLLFAALRIDAKELLAVVLVRDGQFLAAMSATGSQHATPILCGHSLAETVLVDATAVVRLKCSFHLYLLLIYYLFLLFSSLCPSYGLQNYA